MSDDVYECPYCLGLFNGPTHWCATQRGEVHLSALFLQGSPRKVSPLKRPKRLDDDG